jgi:hypothetical protein
MKIEDLGISTAAFGLIYAFEADEIVARNIVKLEREFGPCDAFVNAALDRRREIEIGAPSTTTTSRH